MMMAYGTNVSVSSVIVFTTIAALAFSERFRSLKYAATRRLSSSANRAESRTTNVTLPGAGAEA